MLLSGVLVVLLFSSLNSFAQNVKNKKSVAASASIKDSVEALKNIRIDIKKHEKTINFLETEYQSQKSRLRDFNLRRDSIGALVSVLSTLDSSSMYFKVLEAEVTYLTLTLDSELHGFVEEKMILNKKIIAANAKSEYLWSREKSLSEYLIKFSNK